LTARRDGTSRFGKNKQFNNFGAIAAGWIFLKKDLFKGFSFCKFWQVKGELWHYRK